MLVVHLGRWAFLIVGALFVAGVFPFSSALAPAQVDGVTGSLVVVAAPIANLSDGSIVKVHAEAKDMAIYSLTGHICMPGMVTGDHAFDFSGPFCANVPIGAGDLDKTVVLPGAPSGDLEMKVGIGTVEWHNTIGFPYALTCGPGAPCDLVIRAEITNSTAYFQVPLCFGTGCPAAAPVPVGPTARQVSPPPTPTTEPPTTTTTAPPPAAPAEVGGGPKAGVGTGASTKPVGTGTSRSSSTGDLQSAQSVSAVSVPADASSRSVRVFVAAILGALCGARIVQVISRERRRRGTRLGMV